jgi:AcrR family transcriptional regulator
VSALQKIAIAPKDGRHMRHKRSHAAILMACRDFMREGNFRPSIPAVARAAKVSVRTVFQHFKTHDALMKRALNHVDTQEAMLAWILGEQSGPLTNLDRDRLLLALVLGRAFP